MPAPSFDVAVIGSGPAGLAAAEAAREAGAQNVAIVEAAKRLGGECPNRGCVPTKALLRSGDVLRECRAAGTFGVRVGGVGFDFSAMMRRKNRIVNSLTNDARMTRVLSSLGVTLIRGTAAFADAQTLTIGRKTITARAFVIATGSVATIPPIEGIKDVPYLTSDDLVSLRTLPESMCLIGGGPIGVEFADLFASLGVQTTIVEFAPHLIPREEPEISKTVEHAFRERGISLLTATQANAVRYHDNRFDVEVSPADGRGSVKKIRSEVLVVAAGKHPAVESLRLKNAGVRLNERGSPILDAYLRTTNKRIYMAGDVAGQMMFTHVAHAQGDVAGTNAVLPKSKRLDLRVIPRGTFCTPEVGSVGMTEAEARKKTKHAVTGIGTYASVGKSAVTGHKTGFVKIVADRKTRHILGGHIVGHAAAELVHEIALAMQGKIPVDTVANMVHAYPTFAEAVGVAAFDAVNREAGRMVGG